MYIKNQVGFTVQASTYIKNNSKDFSDNVSFDHFMAWTESAVISEMWEKKELVGFTIQWLEEGRSESFYNRNVSTANITSLVIACIASTQKKDKLG